MKNRVPNAKEAAVFEIETAPAFIDGLAAAIDAEERAAMREASELDDLIAADVEAEEEEEDDEAAAIHAIYRDPAYRASLSAAIAREGATV